MLQGGFNDNFSGLPLITDSVCHVGELSVENLEISLYAKGRRLSLLQTQGFVCNCSRFIKKYFMFLEELNRRIHESGLNLRLPCIPYNTGHFTFSPDFSHVFSNSDHFSGIQVESLLHYSQLQGLLFIISR